MQTHPFFLCQKIFVIHRGVITFLLSVTFGCGHAKERSVSLPGRQAVRLTLA